ncbi:hypothetical protein BST81_03870 [Leptolyngbya sp. 'hensonii']|uniref:hypothetical protein n=1 Tax=Leptolyngbya sp. 'hensonii' TaxID=1922337 RepID=UPI00094FF311|nr:hypothetical protein [Leptolyngbya sp. 'hensonii']OLP19689.1 hypothetical protein BST81_03870 [Leptolyngbya sp. 'hensonii']
MQARLVWQYGSSNPENGDHLAAIGQWWSKLNGQEITWQQRVLTPMGDVSELNWDPQRFDEKFVLTTPEIRGITLYWRKPDIQEERNITVQKLELDALRQQLYAFPQSQPDIVLRVGLPAVVYQQVDLTHPRVEVKAKGSEYVLTLRDEAQVLEVRATLTQAELAQLKQQLP